MGVDASSEICDSNLKVQVYVVALGISLMVIKFFAWIITGSVAILTDAMESIVNVIAAFVGLYALYLTALPRDVNHPFGHGKIELVSSWVEGMLIIAAGLMILFQAISHLINPEKVVELDLGLFFIALTAVLNYIAGRYAIHKGNQNRSMALISSGKHLCTDTYSSLGIIIGLTIMDGLRHAGIDAWWIDPSIAVIFGVLIMVTGVHVVKVSMDGVMDRLDEEVVSEVSDIVNEVRSPSWIDVHNLRVTRYGPLMHIELNLLLPGHFSIENQQEEVSRFKEAAEDRFGKYIDVIVMAKPCGTHMCPVCELDCERRRGNFTGKVEWNVDTMTDETEDHSITHIVERNKKSNLRYTFFDDRRNTK